MVYHRPYKRDLIFGNAEDKALVPYGQYWRLGAMQDNLETNQEILREVLAAGNIASMPFHRSWYLTKKKIWLQEPNYDKDIMGNAIAVTVVNAC